MALDTAAPPAKTRRPDVGYVVKTHAEMIVSITTQPDGDLTIEFDQFSLMSEAA